MQSEDELHIAAKTHIGGIFIAAADLVRKLDRPGMTIELLRASNEAWMFRRQVSDFSCWLKASLAAQPDSVVPPEARTFLHYWFNELERMENR